MVPATVMELASATVFGQEKTVHHLTAWEHPIAVVEERVPYWYQVKQETQLAIATLDILALNVKPPTKPKSLHSISFLTHGKYPIWERLGRGMLA
jgi:hypothetical protein